MIAHLKELKAMIPYSVFEVPLDQRPPLNRGNINKFLLGYIKAALEGWPFHDIHSIDEATYVQMVTDCTYFWNRFKDEVGELVLLHDIPLESLGYRFWYSRRDDFSGFMFDDHKYVEVLHAASLGFGPVWLAESDSGDLIYVWEEPNDTEGGFDLD